MARLITQRELAEEFREEVTIISHMLRNVQPVEKVGRFNKYDKEEALEAMRQWYMEKRAYYVSWAQKWTMKAMAIKDAERRLKKEETGT